MPFRLPFGVPLRVCLRRRALSKPDISWVYDFWSAARRHIFVREEDLTIIVPPNLVYKTNRTGVSLLQFLDSGGRFEEIPGMNEMKLCDIVSFMGDIRSLMDGESISSGTLPYDFDFTRLPVLGEIAVTYRCNNRCRFCYAGCGQESPGKLPAAKSGPELDTAGFAKIIDIFRDSAKIPFFSFTGGEPLLCDDLEKLISYAVSRGLRTNLITNGTLADSARASSLAKAGLETAQVSLESPDDGIHDTLCGIEGSWKATVSGIEALRGAGISVQTNSTITAFNRDSLLSMPGFLKSIGVERFSMNLFIPSRENPNSAELFVPYSDIGKFVDRIASRARASALKFLWYSPTPLCLYNPMARGFGNKNCAAADGLLSVDPAGNVLPCSSYPEHLGNVLADDFASIWFSARAGHFKKKKYAPETCSGCASFTACQAACPLYWDFAGFSEIAGKARGGVA